MQVRAINEGLILSESASGPSKESVEVEHVGEVNQNRGWRVNLLLYLVLIQF